MQPQQQRTQEAMKQMMPTMRRKVHAPPDMPPVLQYPFGSLQVPPPGLATKSLAPPPNSFLPFLTLLSLILIVLILLRCRPSVTLFHPYWLGLTSVLVFGWAWATTTTPGATGCEATSGAKQQQAMQPQQPTQEAMKEAMLRMRRKIHAPPDMPPVLQYPFGSLQLEP